MSARSKFVGKYIHENAIGMDWQHWQHDVQLT